MTAFLADQGDLLDDQLERARTEGFDDLAKVAVFQSTVANVASETGLAFGALADHDAAALEAATVSISTLDDVAW